MAAVAGDDAAFVQGMMKTLLAMETVTEPMVVHRDPLDEREAVNVLPLRTRRSQRGMLDELPVVVWLVVVVPLVLDRLWNRIPLAVVGVSPRKTFRDPASSVSRTMRPALASVFTFWSDVNRTTSVQSPLVGWLRKRNWSAVPPRSAPEATTVNAALL